MARARVARTRTRCLRRGTSVPMSSVRTRAVSFWFLSLFIFISGTHILSSSVQCTHVDDSTVVSSSSETTVPTRETPKAWDSLGRKWMCHVSFRYKAAAASFSCLPTHLSSNCRLRLSISCRHLRLVCAITGRIETRIS